MTSLVTTAQELAEKLHAGQRTKDGEDYFQSHLKGVVAMLLLLFPDASDKLIAAAYLHDALEDTTATQASLEAAGLPDDVIRWIEQVTRNEDTDYQAWIEDLCKTGAIEAVMVKYADNRFNRATMFRLGQDHARLIKRYDRAGTTLEERLRKNFGTTS